MIKQLDKPPISGEYEEIIFDINSDWHGQIWNFVLFTTSDGSKWVGHFRSMEGNNFMIAVLQSLNIACIISGGHGYIIDIDKKKKIKDLKQDMIIDLKADDLSKSFFISTYWSIHRIDSALNEIEIDLPVGPDGIFFMNTTDRKLFIKLDEIGADLKTNFDYYIDLNELTIKKRH